MQQERIGWIGMGNIGLHMAKRLAAAGYTVTVAGHSRREPVEEMKRLGAREAATPKEVAEASDVVFTMVRDVPQTETVLYGPGGLWSSLRPGMVLVLSSTLLPNFCSDLAQKGKEVGVTVIDAPVSGGPWGAGAGTLTFFVGAEEADFERCRPIFEAMGKSIFHLGAVGTGQVAKLSNNLLLWIHILATSEAVRMAELAGLPSETLLKTIEVSTGGSWVVKNWQDMLDLLRSDEGRVLKLQYKDTDLALKYANGGGLLLPIGGLVSQLGLPPGMLD